MKKNENTEYIYLGYSCNQDCLFCVTGGQVGAKEYGDVKTHKVVKKITESKKSGLIFNGGEVTIRKDLAYLAKVASYHGFENISLLSNGVNLSNFSFSKLLVESGINKIGVCVYAHTPDLYDELVQRKGHFKKMVEGVHNLFKLRDSLGFDLEIELKTLVCKPTVNILPEIIDFIIDEFPSPDDMRIHGLCMGGSAIRNADKVFFPLSEGREKIIEAAEKAIKNFNIFNMKQIPPCILGEKKWIKYTHSFEDQNVVINYNKGRDTYEVEGPNRNKSGQCEKCNDCIFADKCSGVWHSYGEYTNWEEIKPFTR